MTFKGFIRQIPSPVGLEPNTTYNNVEVCGQRQDENKN